MVRLKYTLTGLRTGVNLVVFNLPAGLTVAKRKMHRACLDYHVTGGYVKDSQATTMATFCTAYDNWVTRAAIRRGRNMWLEMHKDLFKNNPGLKPKWHDYKPALLSNQITGNDYAISQSDTVQVINQWVPEDWNNQTLPHDDRGQTFSVFTTENGMPATVSGSATNLVDTDKDEFTSHIIGAHVASPQAGGPQYTSVGLVTSWMGSRPDIDPITTISTAESDVIESDPLNMLFNDGDADNEIIENFQNAEDGSSAQEGDIFPMYSNQVINTLEEVAAAQTSAAAPISYFTGFNALTGQVLARINFSGSLSDNVEFVFDVDPKGRTI